MRVLVLALGCSLVAADFVAKERDTGNEVNIPTRKNPFTAEHVHTGSIGENLFLSQYKSQDIKLYTGEAWFTLPDVTRLPMPSPGGPWALLGANYDIVDGSTGKSAPLSEMYSHHWLVYDKLVGSSGFNIGCGGEDTFISNVYGAGGEMRGINYHYPPGFGKIYQKNRYWSANMHFIRTEDLSTKQFNGSYGLALKACIECEYTPGKAVSCIPGLQNTAIFACCFDGSRCPVNNRLDKTQKTYNLVYNITWTQDVANIKDVDTYVMDGFDCEICENLVPHKTGKWTTCDDKVCKTQGTRTMPVSGTLHWGYTHQHSGAINSTLSVNGKPHCTSYPHYGTDPKNTPGNEKGYAVGFHMCINPTEPTDAIHVNKGDTLTLTAYASVDEADTRALPIPGGKHTGFMHLFFFVVNPDAADEFTCQQNVCVPQAGGLPLKTCQAACGGATLV